MRSKMLWIVLLLLSFNILHDSFIVMLDQNSHTDAIHCISSESPVQECDNLGEIHKMFHLMAIMIQESTEAIWLPSEEALAAGTLDYVPPYTETAHKPPIA